jgi:hypothetical protein
MGVRIIQVAIPPEKMTTVERFRIIKDVRDVICHSNEDIPFPK